MNENKFVAPLTQKESLHVFLIYEDSACGLRALDTFNRVSKEMNALVETSAWRADFLPDPACQQEARAKMHFAEVVAVAIHGDSDLPGSWKDWLAAAMHNSSPNRLLVAVLEPGKLAHQNESYLRTLAAGAGLDFLSNLPAEARPRPQPKLISWSGGGDFNPPIVHGTILDTEPHYTHWGINE